MPWLRWPSLGCHVTVFYSLFLDDWFHPFWLRVQYFRGFGPDWTRGGDPNVPSLGHHWTPAWCRWCHLICRELRVSDCQGMLLMDLPAVQQAERPEVPCCFMSVNVVSRAPEVELELGGA